MISLFHEARTGIGGRVSGAVTLGALGVGLLQAGDWPQFRGPEHNANAMEHIRQDWPASGPRQVWRKPMPGGFSSFTVAAGKAFTLIRRTVGGVDSEVCVAVDSQTGAELWASPIGPASYTDGADTGAPGNTGGDGPRTTPVYDGGRVYTLSALLSLACWDASNGQRQWVHDLVTEYGGTVIGWQNGASPLVEGDLVIVNGGGVNQRVLAFRKTTGALVWKGLNEGTTHSTPVAVTMLGQRQVIFATQSGLLSIAPGTGAQLWRSSLSYSTSTGISPVVADDVVYLSAAYNIGAMAVKVTQSGGALSAARQWRKSAQLMNHWSTPVHDQGYLYGLYGYAEYGTAPLKCVDLATGTEQWSVDGFGHGGVMLVDGVLLVLSDAGDLVMVNPNPAAYQELHRFHAINGKCWNTPSLSNGRLYLRSTKEAVCYDVSLPGLRVAPAARPDGSGWQLEVKTADGTALDSARAGRLTLRTAPDLAQPASGWAEAGVVGQLSNGVLRYQLPWGAQPGARFYLVADPP